ncbi:hypothetical protein AAVH_27716 [Aphelenchoides avenae]|nr:hypothetical protein AAVH_27716 [Aphelenchus avenae]
MAEATTMGYKPSTRIRNRFKFGELSVPDVPFVLANHTSYPLNPRWASDGILALSSGSSENLQPIFDALGVGQEVSLFLNK